MNPQPAMLFRGTPYKWGKQQCKQCIRPPIVGHTLHPALSSWSVQCLCAIQLYEELTVGYGLVSGGVLQAFMFPSDGALGRLGNSIAWWLGIEPYELFLYVFLPPLLLDAAVRIDFFLFKRVRLQASAASWISKHSLSWQFSH